MKNTYSGPRPVCFGSFELDANAGELRKRGVRIRLQEQPLRVLQMLLESPGQLVTREELRSALWPTNTFVDFDNGLNRAINKLREALGDSAESPRFIETIAKRGYRFIGDLGTGSATSDSIVVLPFMNMSADPENEYFADGVTEEIINALAQIRDLHVVARSSAFSFKGKHIDPRIVGEQLNVRTILEGSVRRADNQLRITVQLVNAADGFHLWSERYDREMKDVFAIQDEIARSIVRRLQVGFEGDEAGSLVKPGTQNLEAYQLYVKGRALLYKRGSTIPRALECCQRAVTLDPQYALAWAGLADSYTALGYYGLARPEESMPKAMEAARRAVALDPSLAEAHNALAMASLMGTWNRAEAKAEFLRAIDLNPRYLQAHGWYALFYLQWSEGQLAEGMAQAKVALVSDPLSSYAHTIYALTCMAAGNLAEAIQASRRALELDSTNYLAHVALLEALRLSGELGESIAAGQLALAMSGRHAWAMNSRALTFADWGKSAEADAVYCEMLARARHQYVAPGALALAASAAAREDDAVRHAREAFETRDPHCQFLWSRYFPASARLYAYTGFREIIVLMGRSAWLQN
jgi:TolB-like protein/Tfp pilus assembly protein PilF